MTLVLSHMEAYLALLDGYSLGEAGVSRLFQVVYIY